jgi:hypothetical protein
MTENMRRFMVKLANHDGCWTVEKDHLYEMSIYELENKGYLSISGVYPDNMLIVITPKGSNFAEKELAVEAIAK